MKQAELLHIAPQDTGERQWLRAALRECLSYGEHGVELELIGSRERCFNCLGDV